MSEKRPPFCFDIHDWHTPATDYPEEVHGDAMIVRQTQEEGVYDYWGMDNYIYYQVTKEIPITALALREKPSSAQTVRQKHLLTRDLAQDAIDLAKQVRNKGWNVWMVDDPPQQRAMELLAADAEGKVLTTGLGLGLICHELVKNPRVDSITVIERNLDVITLIGPHVPKEVNILCRDFYQFIQEDPGPWDTIIVDLWVSHGGDDKRELFCQEVLPLAADLKEKFPAAKISYHGFLSISDTKVVSPEAMNLIRDLRPYGRE